MADTDVIKGEEAKLRNAQWDKLTKAILQEWTREGYDQYAHLDGLTGCGDMIVITNFWLLERHRPKPMTLASMLAMMDMTEIGHTIRIRQRPPAA
ncbi:MAG TPA: hypothetical protein VL614_15045 [Acetobacteraceae bacterium]|jgi:hypothetical protein|nr:hypothetical protein [Acetobacteraceae bacterium]